MASALNSVTPTSYFDMSSLSLRASVSQMKRGDELSSIDLLASPQVKTEPSGNREWAGAGVDIIFPHSLFGSGLGG